MWNVDFVLTNVRGAPSCTVEGAGPRSPTAGGIPTTYSIVVDDLNLDAFPDSELIPSEHTIRSPPPTRALLGTGVPSESSSRFRKLSGTVLAATYGFPSLRTMSETARNTIGWGKVPTTTELRFGRASGSHRKFPVPSQSPSSQFSTLPFGTCFDIDFVPFGEHDIQLCGSGLLCKEHRTAFLKTYLLWDKSTDFWASIRDLAKWVTRTLGTKLLYLMADSDPIWTVTAAGSRSLDTQEARRLKQETGIEFRRKPANSHSLDIENSVGRVRATMNTFVQHMHMNGPRVASFAFVHSATVLNHLS